MQDQNKMPTIVSSSDSVSFTLQELSDLGIIESTDAVKKMIKSKEFKKKETTVLNIHKNKITKTTEKKRDKVREVYQTRLDGKRPRRYTYEELIEYLYDYYYPEAEITDLSFKKVFELALDEKIRTEAPTEKTIRDYHSSYKAFITDDFGNKDIRLIKPSEVKEYIQTITQELNVTMKRLYKLKGVLNLVFNYANDPEHAIISVNPVPSTNAAYKKNCSYSSKKPEDKAFQPDEIELIQDYLWERVKRLNYDVNGYAILFSIETGVREGEIPSLKWSDISENAIHIHSQQNDENRDGKKIYYYNPSTKNEKRASRGGRYFPITEEIRRILESLKAKQDKLGIKSEWVFCKYNGEWITTVGYYESLYKLSNKLNLSLSNNHAFRMALNSYVFIPAGLPASERAKLLGHSIQTNLNHYSFARADDYINELKDTLNRFKNPNEEVEPQLVSGNLNIISFEAKEKSLRTPNSLGI